MSTTTLIKQWTRTITASSSAKVGIIELCSPSNRNALSTAMLLQLQSAITTFQNDDNDVRAVVIKSSPGSNVFSSGHDLKQIRLWQQQQQQQGNNDDINSIAAARELFFQCSSTMKSIAQSPIPFIASVDGMATAAGCQLVASCDLAYATKRSTFATPGIKIGLFCSTPAVAVGRSVVGRKHAMEMLLTGDPVSAQRAADTGLINGPVLDDANQLEQKVNAVVDAIARTPTAVIQRGKEGFSNQMSHGHDLDRAYNVASTIMSEDVWREECIEGIDAFLEKRPPNWKN
eukprot:CAMPEP_0118691240 /NCGR_PEP_ID=MMETSP0800-20121206/10566_1 /TAXON_ID=210618 ORGANISM="Striatella unipunctata, Strain CCMP2910" /NCGR_SAMPLE_ID=MMETSP0800 /ASSEMBLY_ACC=CAM_ASM_000638 /LENGTH=287 /DNA_ID=CAMNT_0006588989 /DNA_START=782 /DNA_END=1645 /DNA_ORIENTATION=-